MANRADELMQEAAELRDRARKVLDATDGQPTAEDEERFDRLMGRARELRERAGEIEDERETRRRKLEREVGAATEGDMMEDETRDAPRYRARKDEGGEVRSFVPGRESLYEQRKRQAGWEDFWDDVTLSGYLLARDTNRGPQTEAERRALSSADMALPDPLQARFLETLLEGSLAGRLGIPTVNMQSDSERLVRVKDGGDVGGSWKAEGSTHSSTDMSLQTVTFNAKSRTGVVKISRESFDDSLGVEAGLRRSFQAMLRRGLNDAIMKGGGGNAPTGIANSTAFNQTEFGGSSGGTVPSATGDGWNEVVRAREALIAREVNPSNLRMVTSPRVARQFHSLKATDNQPIRRPDVLQGVPFVESVSVATTLSSTNGATSGSEIVLGDFSRAVAVGIRLDPEVRIIDAALAETWELAFVGGMRADVQFPRSDAAQRLYPITT